MTKMISLILLAASLKVQAQSVIKIDGSSTVFPITEAVSEEFQKIDKTRVTVGISGTGGGFKKFCRGETDIQNASRPISESEMETCKAAGIKFIELPIAYDALVVAVNPKNTWAQEITLEELKKMWEPAADKTITQWSQINAKWPKENIKLYGAGTDSGTFDYFTEAINGKSKASRSDFTASEDDNTLVTGIAGDKFALGYLPLSYYEENKVRMKALAIIGGEKSPKKNKGVIPSSKTVIDGSYFPLSRPIFIYVSEASMKKPEVKAYAEFYLANAPKLVPEVKYVALPAKAYAIGKENLKKNKLGTLFGGHSSIGMKIEDLMKREGKM